MLASWSWSCIFHLGGTCFVLSAVAAALRALRLHQLLGSGCFHRAPTSSAAGLATASLSSAAGFGEPSGRRSSAAGLDGSDNDSMCLCVTFVSCPCIGMPPYSIGLLCGTGSRTSSSSYWGAPIFYRAIVRHWIAHEFEQLLGGPHIL